MTLLKVRKLTLSLAILSMISPVANAAELKPPPFMPTRGVTTQPIGHYEFCLTHASECSVKSKSYGPVELTADRWNQLVAVNNDVNTKIAPATDEELFGRPEVWVYPTTKGDCEDYVLLKRRALIADGWPIGALLITVVRQKNGDGQAVLTVRTDRGDLVLDNLDAHIKLWSDTEYQYIKRQAEYDTGKWVSIDDGHASEVGSVSN